MKGKKDDGSMVSALANALTRNPLPALLLTCLCKFDVHRIH